MMVVKGTETLELEMPKNIELLARIARNVLIKQTLLTIELIFKLK